MWWRWSAGKTLQTSSKSSQASSLCSKIFHLSRTGEHNIWSAEDWRAQYLICRGLESTISSPGWISSNWMCQDEKSARVTGTLTSHLMSSTFYERLQSSWLYLIRSQTGNIAHCTPLTQGQSITSLNTNIFWTYLFLHHNTSFLVNPSENRSTDICICIFNWTVLCQVSKCNFAKLGKNSSVFRASLKP